MEDSQQGAVLAELAKISFDSETLEGVLSKVADAATVAIPGCDHASVTLSGDKGLRTAAATDDVAREIDAREYEMREGPCVAAVASRRVEQIQSTEDPKEWIHFAEMMASFDVHSALGVPLGDEVPGAINAYSRAPHAFDEDAIEAAELLALFAGVAVKNAQSFSRLSLLVGQLNEALQTRETIGKAIGVVMEREGRSEDEAFDLLRQVSQNSNVKLRD
ncbi:MAG TPA: GAF and ANTAR domain-containing protein, partial [Actinomycetota bacterium]|nr:GAF and ANTAR domain-containing protein [Actinomycetota bacterium]